MKRGSQLVGFFAIAFGFTWGCWLSTRLVRHEAVRYWLQMTGTMGPMLAAVIMTALAEGQAGLRQLLRSLVNWRFNPALAMVALLLPPISFYLAIALTSWWRSAQPPHVHSYNLLYDVIFNFFLTVLWGGPLGEEPGWRGYALPRLELKLHPIMATVILGLLWAVWHFPRWWIAGEFPIRIVSLYVIGSVAFSIVFTYLYNRSGGSVLPCLLLHGSTNTFYVLLPMVWAWTAWTLIICVIAAVIVSLDQNLGMRQLSAVATAGARAVVIEQTVSR